MPPVVHPGRSLKREMVARNLSANRLSLDIGVPSGRVTDILNGRRAITADTAVRFGLYFGNSAQFWLGLQSHHDIGVVEREKGTELAKRVRPADAGPRQRGAIRSAVPPYELREFFRGSVGICGVDDRGGRNREAYCAGQLRIPACPLNFLGIC